MTWVRIPGKKKRFEMQRRGKLKIATIVGARPQFVKAGVLSREIAKSDDIEEILIHTGQHYDNSMSQIFFDEMQINKPKYNLSINSLNHGAMTGRMIEGLEAILVDEKPDWVVVFGDTNSTLAGALAARKLNIRLAHVEAGLRSQNLKMPEEVNRILVDRISDVLFYPTDVAYNNLLAEGFRNFNCVMSECGDLMKDAVLYYKDKARLKSSIVNELSLQDGNYCLCTFHRNENLMDDSKLREIVDALNWINSSIITVIVPLHPGSKRRIEELGLDLSFKTIPPQGYFDMLELLRNCRLVLTDSGGLQKEAYFFDKYCITLREETEWIELVENQYNYLVGSNIDKIVFTVKYLLQKKFVRTIDFYGDGLAGKSIIDTLKIL